MSKIPMASPWLQRFCEDHAVILGSSSKWRRKVMTNAGCRVSDAMNPDIDEKAIRDTNPEKLVLAISNAKADALMAAKITDKTNPEMYLICTDQVALCDGVIREKPESISEARTFINSYSSERKPVVTCSGVVVVHVASGLRQEGVYYNSIKFQVIPDTVIYEIVNGDVVYTCCGGFSVDDPTMGAWVESIEGGVDGVMGMPLELVEELLKKHAHKE